MNLAQENRRAGLVSLLLLAGTVALYWPVRHHGFISYDDPDYVCDNPYVRAGFTKAGILWAFANLHGQVTYWHPLTWLSHMLDCQCFGLNPAPHHLVNVCFHAVNAVLLFAVLRRMTAAFWRSALVAALFAWHPLQVDTVAWIAERKNLLSGLLFLLLLLAYERYARKPALLRYGLVFLLLCLGLMAKPAFLVAVPCLLLLLDFWPLRRLQLPRHLPHALPLAPRAAGVLDPPACRFPVRSLSRLLLEKLPLLVPVICSSVITLLAHQSLGLLGTLHELPLSARLGNAFVSCLRYAGKTIWPASLAVYYPHPGLWPAWLLAMAVGFVLVVSVFALRRAVRGPWLLAGWLWFMGGLFPAIGIVQGGSQAMADRFAYLPLVGLLVMLVWGLPELLAGWRHRSSLLPAFAILALMAAASLTRVQLQYWRDSVSLFEHALAVTSRNSLAHYNLAKALLDQNRAAEAKAHFAAAVEIDPCDWQAFSNLASLLAQEGHLDQAEACLTRALRINPGAVDVHYNRAITLEQLHRPEESVGEFREVLRLKPKDPQARSDLAEALLELSQALEAQKKESGAVRHLREAIQLRPGWPATLNNLAWVLASAREPALRNGAEAVRLAEQACALAGTPSALLHDTLGAAYAEAGRFADASAAARKAIALAEAAGDTNAAARFRSRLELYLAGKPCREP